MESLDTANLEDMAELSSRRNESELARRVGDLCIFIRELTSTVRISDQRDRPFRHRDRRFRKRDRSFR